jgi:mevalonate kinase
MGTLLTILVLASGLFALVTGVSALRAGLRLRRTYLGLRVHFYTEVARLTDRTAEVEQNLTALGTRVEALPVRLHELQQNLTMLRILSGTLGTSLRQAQRVLSSAGLKSSLARPLAGAFGRHSGTGGGAAGRGDEGEAPRS